MSFVQKLFLIFLLFSMQVSAETPLEAHVRQFAGFKHQSAMYFNNSTVTEGLQRLRSSYASFKGPLIATFNANHMGNRVPGSDTPYSSAIPDCIASSLHLGTTRIWNAGGSIDESRWYKFVQYIKHEESDPERQGRLYKSTLKRYIAHLVESDPDEEYTGRNTGHILSSRRAQVAAADKAWDEAFELFACGWTWSDTLQDYEPYWTIDVTRQFFEDPRAVYELNMTFQLPVAKPKD